MLSFAQYKLQTKVSIIMAALFVASIGLTIALFYFILTPEILALEEKQTLQNLEQIENAIKTEVSRLETQCRDWAHWDDMYLFVKSQDNDFLEGNLYEGIASELRVDLFYILDKKGTVVWHQAENANPQNPILPTDQFSPTHPFLLGNQQLDSRLSGIFSTDKGSILFALTPILKSDSAGPMLGWVLMGQYLNQQFSDSLSEQTRIPFTMQTVSGKAEANMNSNHLSPNAWYELRSDRQLIAYSYLAGIKDGGGLLLEVTSQRDVFNKGTTIRNNIMMLVAFSTLMIFLLISFFVRKFVVAPITALTTSITMLGENKNIQARLLLPGNSQKDETSILVSQVNKLLDTIEEMHSHLVADAMLDPLTSLANRRSYEEHLSREWNRLNRNQGDLSFILCDIDHFKLYNDFYGHKEGDNCLKKVAQLINSVPKRPVDLVARYGGEEFIVVLPETDSDGALFIAEKIRETILHNQRPHKASPGEKVVTLSFGVASTIVNKECTSEDLFKLADKALYQAKKEGRNRVCLAEKI